MHHSSFFVFSVRKIGARNLKYGKNTFMFGDYDDYMKAPKEGEEKKKIKDVLIYAEFDMDMDIGFPGGITIGCKKMK